VALSAAMDALKVAPLLWLYIVIIQFWLQKQKFWQIGGTQPITLKGKKLC